MVSELQPPHTHTCTGLMSHYLSIPSCVFPVQLWYELLGRSDCVLSFCHLSFQLSCLCGVTLKPEGRVKRRGWGLGRNPLIWCFAVFAVFFFFSHRGGVFHTWDEMLLEQTVKQIPGTCNRLGLSHTCSSPLLPTHQCPARGGGRDLPFRQYWLFAPFMTKTTHSWAGWTAGNKC